MTQTICLFNHKGGVSKTTTSFNLGWILANNGKKVLIVDLDSQCNLTELVLGYDDIDENRMDIFYGSRDNLTMKPIVEALINGTSPDQFIQQDKGKLFQTKNENMMLLPGHLDVADLDAQISVALKIASGIPATKNIPGNLPKILQEIAKKENADYVIYDLSPNVGGLNEVIFLLSRPHQIIFVCKPLVPLKKTLRSGIRKLAVLKRIMDLMTDHSLSIINRSLLAQFNKDIAL